jgi:hypothetical protein
MYNSEAHRECLLTTIPLVITALTQIHLTRNFHHSKLAPLFFTSLQQTINYEYRLRILYRIISTTIAHRLRVINSSKIR